MAHTHPVVDSDPRFVINSTTRAISTTSDKLELIQGDHQSERITFEIPKIVEGHDMSLSDRIEVHYINIDRKTNATSRDVYIIDDAAVDGDKLTFSWLISGNATKYYGRLNFIILFECLDPDGNYTYKWNTEICKLLTIGEGISNTSAVIEDHSDILEKFKKEILEEAGEKSIQPDWNQNDSTQPDYVKNRPFYTGNPVETVLVEESTVSFIDDNGVYVGELESTFSATVGETYKVSWDGTTYESTCVNFNNELAIGNLSLLNAGSDTGEPFVVVFDAHSSSIGTLDTSASHTISISEYIESVVKINAKYLPVASETEPGIIMLDNLTNVVLNRVQDRYFTPTDFQVSTYGDANVIKKCVDRNNCYGIIIPGENLGGVVLSCYDSANEYIKSVLSDGSAIKCCKIPKQSTNIEQLWSISEDGIVISSSTANSTKKFRITVDDDYNVSATNTSDSVSKALATTEYVDNSVSNPLNITSAAVGQIAKITAVDDSGKPTAWETVDMPSGGSIPKPLTYDYMPEGYPTKSVQTTTLMEEQEVAFTLSGGLYTAQLTSAFEIVEGQTYTVNWDGTEYECVCVAIDSNPCIGNLSNMGMGDDTGEPFIYGYNIKEAVGMFGTLDTSASHTISVKTTGEIATPIAEEFLPAGVGTAAIIYNSNGNRYSSKLTYDELYKRLLDGKQVVLHRASYNEYLYLMGWMIKSKGDIDLTFGKNYTVTLKIDGTFVGVIA